MAKVGRSRRKGKRQRDARGHFCTTRKPVPTKRERNSIRIGCVGWYDPLDLSKPTPEYDTHQDTGEKPLAYEYWECEMNLHPYLVLESLQGRGHKRFRCAKVCHKS
jgi:hypothetical protein